ncbi:LysR family transcriptional regulator [Streptomyces sp. ISL-43]|uniref:LysR family transcriptional regulator n=1 Tax=Streptomyces sp. ISL-43 TaxID=2819183 RepID=UPI001BEBC72B|nr:LysR family transcriptional regulator [Streptomyces sp. ISL-43]MBT2448300.1 LysR family transcriptional regulator [Streptomyces sp. ISL-43]
MRVTQSGAPGLDLNLLVALDVLVEEPSVSRAAARLHLSEPAMSRTLGRIRKALGDPALVRALAESHIDVPALREGVADLELGMIDTRSPEVRIEHLADERMPAVARSGHPLLRGPVTARRFAAARHLIVSRRGRLEGPVDTALAEQGITRQVVGSVGTFPASLFVLRESDLVGLITSQAESLATALGLEVFEVPLDLPPLPFGMAWHPRHDADPGHAWLRDCARALMRPGQGFRRSQVPRSVR